MVVIMALYHLPLLFLLLLKRAESVGASNNELVPPHFRTFGSILSTAATPTEAQRGIRPCGRSPRRGGAFPSGPRSSRPSGSISSQEDIRRRTFPTTGKTASGHSSRPS